MESLTLPDSIKSTLSHYGLSALLPLKFRIALFIQIRVHLVVLAAAEDLQMDDELIEIY